MLISRVINNNVITAMNEDNKELVIMGLGIAFQKKKGDTVDKSKIEKVFSLENKELTDRLKTLLNKISLEVMSLTEDIINYAMQKTNRKLNESIYISLPDHINFTIERHQQGIDIHNALLWEIKRFYRLEFGIGMEALSIIKERLGVELPEDEAGFIALHIVNAQMNENVPEAANITRLIKEILNIVQYTFRIDLDEESLNYFRFVTHLKFFSQRMFNKIMTESKDEELLNIVKEKYKPSYECAWKIKEYIKLSYDYLLNKDELLYLTIHIERVVNRS
ncbi:MULTISPECIES: BglG family transcription antiterminator LicT [Paenibacillus]|jgi:beta-glucoside operon transcriptional antiterminator|uniref:PRD domain-containing protein n=1 Tax=Paenibacillus polymyxa TaxID=1406 RepID=A0AAP4A2Q4_PAEPO|nr:MULTISPECIES: PRD domain-containing protein [Paenibacillus]AIW40034.1 transcription antiterminator LicT [Paenibacillus polymyxa CR1]ALA42344.1 transcription antiterminator LicT [Paenibacillus peoriae]APB75931.1 PRD domain-containing protein [Paenibacillus polymyxa]APQ59526.1 transcription antiterminator LicT [Paenibacillus polymyxa]MCP3747745.1 PRD domain-containing protein [Paenibacillus sp. A3M_27_13]